MYVITLTKFKVICFIGKPAAYARQKDNRYQFLINLCSLTEHKIAQRKDIYCKVSQKFRKKNLWHFHAVSTSTQGVIDTRIK